MRITAHMSLWMGIVFIALTLTMAFLNLSGGDAGASEADLANAHGYGMFWLFLTGFGVVMVVVSWLIIKGRLGGRLDD
jgi:hypothetical protein